MFIDEVFYNAIRAMEEQHGTDKTIDILSKKCTSPSDAVANCFDWRTSKQGHSYWSDIAACPSHYYQKFPQAGEEFIMRDYPLFKNGRDKEWNGAGSGYTPDLRLTVRDYCDAESGDDVIWPVEGHCGVFIWCISSIRPGRGQQPYSYKDVQSEGRVLRKQAVKLPKAAPKLNRSVRNAFDTSKSIRVLSKVTVGKLGVRHVKKRGQPIRVLNDAQIEDEAMYNLPF